MNISVINIKSLSKKGIKLIIFIISLIAIINIINIFSWKIQKIFNFKFCSNIYSTLFSSNSTNKGNIKKNILIAKFFCPILNINTNTNAVVPNEIISQKSPNIPKTNANIEKIEENNIEESYNYTYKDIKIKNQSKYTLSDDILSPESIELANKKIIIYHTHTCESYTSSEKYNYTMTGNYRTIDKNYNVVKLGDELDKLLTANGFTIIHNKDYHDYPAYNGSYERSLQTVEKIVTDNEDAQVIIDIHRDAVGDGSWYGPSVEINEQKVAQMMFVIRNRWRRIKPSKLDTKFKYSFIYSGNCKHNLSRVI